MIKKYQIPLRVSGQRHFAFGGELSLQPDMLKMTAGDGFSIKDIYGRANVREWQSWLLRAGISEEVHLGVSRTGIYADFT